MECDENPDTNRDTPLCWIRSRRKRCRRWALPPHSKLGHHRKKMLLLEADAVECGESFMIIQTAVICDAATDHQGKLNLLGAFDTISTMKMPAIHPQCSLALRVVFERIEEGQHLFKLKFVDDDGKPVIPQMEVPVVAAFAPDSNFATRNIIINIQNLKFDRAGSYSLEVAADNHHLISIPLSVRAIQMPNSPQLPAGPSADPA